MKSKKNKCCGSQLTPEEMLEILKNLSKMADHYERQSGNFMPNDIRGAVMARAAADMRHVLNDTQFEKGL